MKKILSVILSFVMLLSVTTGMTMTVHATTNKTQNEAVAWAEKQCGKSLDYDGSYGAQCVDLIMYYYKYLGKSIVGGNAKDYATNKLPSGWKRLKSNYSIQPGDIAVFKANVKNFTYEYGHIGIVHSGSNSKFTIIDQNSYEYGKKVAKHKESNYKTSNMLCVIRPDFKSEKSTIGFNANGGSGSMSGKTVSYNTTLTLPAN
ncbi:MAG: CHAP domain-containing protein, partial [Eubacterium sp.]|nr:CHAP domain-containing protein [Eubacterium sp.]